MSGTKSFILFCLLKTVFCEELFGFEITMPDKIPALTGSCVLIPCSYQIEEAFKGHLQFPLTGVWIKGGISGSRVFNSDTKGPDNRWEIPGKLNQNNCTTILRNVTKSDNTTIYFRIEPIKYTYRKGTELTVTGRPRKPKLPPPAEVQEGTPVTLTCTTAAPCPTLPPALTWTPSLNETVEQQEVENEDKTTSVSSVLTFTASHLHHELNITCTALYPLEQSNVTKSSERTVTIRVRYSPKNTSASVSSSGTILQGNSVTLTCSTNANPPVTNYTWFKVNGSKTVQTGAEQTLTFNITDTDSVQYYCEAQNEHGKGNSTTVQLQAEYPPKDTSVSISPSDVVLQDSSVTLTCNSNANPPVRNYTWFKVNEGQVTQTGFGNNLTFKVIKFGDRGQYYCEAKNQHGADKSSEVNVTVKYAPNILNTSSCIRRTSDIICQCESQGKPPPTIEWLLSGHKVSNGSTDHVIKEEQLASGGLKSTLILQITPGNTADIQCVSRNDAGYYRLQFYVAPPESPPENLLNWKTLLIGGAIGAVLMSLFCCLLQCFQKRKKDILRPSLTKTSMEDTAELIHMNGEQQVQTNNPPQDDESVYANKEELSKDAWTEHPTDTLHYTTVDFSKLQPKDHGAISPVIISSGNQTDYAVIKIKRAGVDASGKSAPNEKNYAEVRRSNEVEDKRAGTLPVSRPADKPSDQDDPSEGENEEQGASSLPSASEECEYGNIQRSGAAKKQPLPAGLQSHDSRDNEEESEQNVSESVLNDSVQLHPPTSNTKKHCVEEENEYAEVKRSK
nr:PREDICTED: B-cell receptor CD22-like isoform X1 [Lepisosteus oculatus]XP_015192002.1 PREDICTED: B-cell receptor CD22-like isoform X1 [Lepisosteus oculatus]XP_015192003.1 PREDICTED: B-cell receptor CD22-like isoform X1 [Lepisosteus oculatus]